MSYSPPAADAVIFALSGAYTPPVGDALRLDFGAAATGSISLFCPLLPLRLSFFPAIISPVIVIAPSLSLGLRLLAPSASPHQLTAPLLPLGLHLFVPTPSPLQLSSPRVSLGLSLHPPGVVIGRVAPTLMLGLSPLSPVFEIGCRLPLLTLALKSFRPLALSVFPWHPDAQRIYQIRLEKTGLTPLILAATNISVRSTLEGRSSSITATIPDLSQIDAIAARASAGVLTFSGGYLLDGRRILNDILKLPLTDIRPDKGPNNRSLTLTAKGSSPTEQGKIVTARQIEYQSINGLKRLIRLPVDVTVSPGDTIIAESESWRVGEVVYALNAESGESMTVTEA